MSVDIVMATYNGAKFVREQIASIQNQSYTNWRLLISDDSSTDDTVKIIKEIGTADSRIILVSDSRQGGVVKNFAKALSSVTAEHICFCDQDDLWPHDRLQRMLDYFIVHENNQPLMIYTDLTLIDEKDNVIGDSYYAINGIKPEENLDFDLLRWKSSIYGCSTMMNKSLLEIALPFPEQVTMHDHWIGLVACTQGKVKYFNYKSVLYRQHSSNVVGGRKKTLLGKIGSIKTNIKKIEDAALKTLSMQYVLQERFAIRFSKKSFIINNIYPGLAKTGKKAYTIIFMVCFIKCSI
ncbi:glycosyltransferase [Leclercia sp. J807]|uniref:glycosyltransferase family 2 protein n=1 Tax=Leclercia sp. J807 TaxID=2681307 RepID=UPI0012E18B27|nr:glycosyltransferase family 2 protein [Leclercia sp. J807]QGU11517.1 glycosyltransferase [Leclercia sp. J807]